jgi:hypothetical protein
MRVYYVIVLKAQYERSGGIKMNIDQIITLMYENEKSQMVCMQDINENVLFIGTVADLRKNYRKALKREIITMYTERYGAFNNVSGLTIIV